tara:strand:+ start:1840 stop:3072 length:1233 start_codon:yes stop_codon:yes gene_type:complete
MLTKEQIEDKVELELADWTVLWDAVEESGDPFDIDKFVTGQYLRHNDESAEFLLDIMQEDGTYDWNSVKNIYDIFNVDEDPPQTPPPNTETGPQKNFYEGDAYDANRNISWVENNQVTEPQAFTSHFDANYLTKIFAQNNSQIIVEYQDAFVEAGLLTADEQAQELGYWGPLTKNAFKGLLMFIDDSLDFALNSPKFNTLKSDIQRAFQGKTFVTDPAGIDFYAGHFKEADEPIPENILTELAIREVLNIGLNKRIQAKEAIEKQTDRDYEEQVRLQNAELDEYQLKEAVTTWAKENGYGEPTEAQLSRAFGAYAEAYDPYIKALVDQNNAIRNNTYLNQQWPMDTISQYEQTGSMPDVPKYKDFFYKEDPLTTAVKSIEDEKEAESDMITQAQEIENQKIRLLNLTLGR